MSVLKKKIRLAHFAAFLILRNDVLDDFSGQFFWTICLDNLFGQFVWTICLDDFFSFDCSLDFFEQLLGDDLDNFFVDFSDDFCAF